MTETAILGGGPIANYMSHAVVAMVQRLRREGRNGFLFANGGLATDNHCIVLSAEPIALATFPHDFDYQAQADAARGAIPALDQDYLGPVVIESYTVFHDRDGMPASGVVVARTPQDNRTLAHIDVRDAATLAFFTAGLIEPVGKPGRIGESDGSRTWQA